jgi:PKD repeat protein
MTMKTLCLILFICVLFVFPVSALTPIVGYMGTNYTVRSPCNTSIGGNGNTTPYTLSMAQSGTWIPYDGSHLNYSVYTYTSWWGYVGGGYRWAALQKNNPESSFPTLMTISTIDNGYPGTSGNPTYIVDTFPQNNSVYMQSTDDGNYYCWFFSTQPVTGYIYPVPVADFNGTPLMGLPPLTVAFKDNSTNTPTLWNWSVSPAGGVYIANASAQDTSMIFTLEGNYTITHGVATAHASAIATKSNYIWIQNSTTITSTYVTAIAQSSGNPIPGAVIDLKDVENSSWTNMTTGSSATANITTLKGHTINGYASAAGFNDNDYLGMPAGSWYSILLMSPFTANVTAGNVTLNVNVYDSFGHAPINGAGVTVISNVSQVNGYTNSAGVASFAVKNKTTYLVDVEAIGQQYKGATQSVYTGTGSGGSASVTATFYLDKNNAITPTATITTLPGGGTPTPTQTYLAGCDPSSSTYDAATCRGSHSNSALNFLADNMDNLIMVCVFVTILYLFGIKLGR